METPTPTTKADGSVPVLLAWEAPIHPVHERTARWYAVGSGIVVVTAIAGIATGAWTLAVVSVLIGVMYFLLRKTGPVIRRIAIDENGFAFAGTFTAWNDCGSFWIVRTPHWHELHIRRKSGFAPDTRIQTGGIGDAEIRAVLSQYLTEASDRKERLMDRLIRLCKL